MHCTQHVIKSPAGSIPSFTAKGKSSLLLVFAPRECFENENFLTKVRECCPAGTHIAGCSSAGEISAEGALDHSAIFTYITFDHTDVTVTSQPILDANHSLTTGHALATKILAQSPQPNFIIVLSDGLNINGTELVNGMQTKLQGKCLFSGGLAGDAARFQKTFVMANGVALENTVVAIALTGEKLRYGTSSVAGWCPFGTFRKVTDSNNNVLKEIDGINALHVYSSYLGRDAENLPASGLLYPLEVHQEGKEAPIIRTLLAVDREKGTMTFAGDIPQNSIVRLMNSSYDQVVDGAGAAATQALAMLPQPKLALLFSCVGRKLALDSYTDLEIESVVEKLPADTTITGFHSYGEIGLDQLGKDIQLHNQTMTITLLSEAE